MCLAANSWSLRDIELSQDVLASHEGFFALRQTLLARSGRTYAINFLRTIHTLANANKVTICAVFFFKPH